MAHDKQNDCSSMKKYALLENIRSLYNVGSIFRSSDAVGLHQLFLTGYTGFPPRDQISKVALGAELSVPWKHYKDPAYIIRKLKAQGVQIIALEVTNDAIDIGQFKLQQDYCLLVGNEVTGLSKKLLNLADITVKLPMSGIKESLNVACAYTAAIYCINQNMSTNKSGNKKTTS
jgi:23S rRNA (guanosine2251-2'-O)-methyltransferase